MWSSYLIDLSPEEMTETFVEHGWRVSELSAEHARALLDRGDPSRAFMAASIASLIRCFMPVPPYTAANIHISALLAAIPRHFCRYRA